MSINAALPHIVDETNPSCSPNGNPTPNNNNDYDVVPHVPLAIWLARYAILFPNLDLSSLQLDRVKSAASARSAKHNASTGPKTPAGKAISSLNARTHGWAGSRIVLAEEDLPAYEAHLASYHATFNPQNQPESDIVRQIANAMWRVDRLTSIETGLLDLEIELQTPQIDGRRPEGLPELEPQHYLAIGFMEQTRGGGKVLELCRRYLSGAQRDYSHNLDTSRS